MNIHGVDPPAGASPSSGSALNASPARMAPATVRQLSATTTSSQNMPMNGLNVTS